MSLQERGPEGGSAIMVCHVCHGKCHAASERRGYRVIGTDANHKPLFEAILCRQCMCHDCIQLGDHPIHQTLAPDYLEQTIAKPFNLQGAVDRLEKTLGMRGETPKLKARGLPRESFDCVRCKKRAAKSRCVRCLMVLCASCLGRHECPGVYEGGITKPEE